MLLLVKDCLKIQGLAVYVRQTLLCAAQCLQLQHIRLTLWVRYLLVALTQELAQVGILILVAT
jgi:hypothetical protein